MDVCEQTENGCSEQLFLFYGLSIGYRVARPLINVNTLRKRVGGNFWSFVMMFGKLSCFYICCYKFFVVTRDH